MGRRNATLAFWGQKDFALSLLKSSIVAGHCCAYNGLRNDSAFATLRSLSYRRETVPFRFPFREISSCTRSCPEHAPTSQS